MDTNFLWLSEPSETYRLWQKTDAVGADRKPFSARSRVQHAAMFDRFLRHIKGQSASIATFDAAHIESFFNEMDRRIAPGTSTRLRYAKMLNHLCRHLVEIGLRSSNPVAELIAYDRCPRTSRDQSSLIRPLTYDSRRGPHRQRRMIRECSETARSLHCWWGLVYRRASCVKLSCAI
ncbi:hypothetical protein [Paraburkholderia youngii]|uniref:hypothetical protein n=1 Tax=Paraburkholderia youngii TaxID=2782701 RepID=UPI001FE43C3A|nr:hypothetical protein [Paraburkholderia youngii]